MIRYKKAHINDNCINCGFCNLFVVCSGKGDKCIGCGACAVGCPQGAIEMVDVFEERKHVEITVDGKKYTVPEKVTVLFALSLCGYSISTVLPNEADIFAPCGTGTCGACSVIIDGELKPSCTTEVKDGMVISTKREEIEKLPPKRMIAKYMGYPYGPAGFYRGSPRGYTEFSCFVQGCNLRCPTCHNWDLTFSTTGKVETPKSAASSLIYGLSQTGVRKVGLSGGEVTLNRRWLIELLKILKDHDKEMRIQIDTNGTILTKDYIEELFAIGANEISPDIKGKDISTFKKITGIDDDKIASIFLKNSWEAISILLDEYFDKFFIVLAIPFNLELISYDELSEIGAELSRIRKDVPINLVQFQPAFRWREMKESSLSEIQKGERILRDRGLTRIATITSDLLPEPLDPEDLLLGSESF